MLTNPAYGKVAQEFGLFGEAVTEDSEVDGAISRWLDADGPSLLDVHVDPEMGA